MRSRITGRTYENLRRARRDVDRRLVEREVDPVLHPLRPIEEPVRYAVVQEEIVFLGHTHRGICESAHRRNLRPSSSNQRVKVALEGADRRVHPSGAEVVPGDVAVAIVLIEFVESNDRPAYGPRGVEGLRQLPMKLAVILNDPRLYLAGCAGVLSILACIRVLRSSGQVKTLLLGSRH